MKYFMFNGTLQRNLLLSVLTLCGAATTLAQSYAANADAGESGQIAAESAHIGGGGFPTPHAMAALPGYSDYKIAAHDVLLIEVYQAPEFSRAARVKPDGTVRLPLFREPVRVMGLSAAEAETAIAEGLINQGLLVDPIVAVEVRDHHGSPVRVSGAVQQSVVMQAVGPTTLLDAVTQAGGLTEEAGPVILVERGDRSNGGAQVIRVSTQDFRQGLPTAHELQLWGGERVRVPPAPTAFVIGAINNPGPVPILDKEGIDFLHLMAIAGARLSQGGMAKKAFVLRPREGDGTGRERIEINIKELVKYEMASFTVHPDDVVYFPPKRSQRLLRRVGEGLLTQAIWGFGFWLFR